ncbi:MAG: hypothetical protein Q8M24_25795 [Pseudolabrys sp.]|nr:hypothetical protein [Pseudolabrys sp.]MDP2298867.1 hypothetical protein [Pseudolabrys sp.]
MIAQRPTRTTAQALTGVALSLVLAAAVMAVPSPASADEEEAFDTRILRGILEGIGLQRDQKIINYQERPPLVIPPSRTLPPPERSDALIANNPAWPKDPDVLRAKEEAARERNAFTTADEALRREQRPLRPDEMTPGAKPRDTRRVARTTQEVGSSSDYGRRLTPSQLGYSGGLFGNMFGRTDDDTAKFTGEPPRTALTEPPRGYQTPSPDQPYGLSGRTTAPKAYDYKTQRGTDLEK